jgi:hypothetical protein
VGGGGAGGGDRDLANVGGLFRKTTAAQRLPPRAREASRGATYPRECGEARKGGQVLRYLMSYFLLFTQPLVIIAFAKLSTLYLSDQSFFRFHVTSQL